MTKSLSQPAPTGIDVAAGLGLRHRPRRLRRSPAIRALVRETRLSADMFIYPLFVCSGEGQRREVPSMPGVYQLSVDEAVREAAAAKADGVPGVLLFGLPDDKDAVGSAAADPDAPVQAAVRALKRDVPGLLVVTDVCLCEYTSHGHCGVVHEGRILNDPSVELLTGMALAHARAGADFVAPSDMMDGRVAALRRALDAEGKVEVGILSYSAKFASAYYGPFREAAGSKPAFGDRRTYQMDLRNGREAVREIVADELEGADMVMVKPALAYLDVVARARDATRLPIVAYNVSGEYSMVKAAAERGWVDEAAVVRENLTAIARAGADLIITYHGRSALEGKWLS
jgi:porphobilinogen synthase